MKVCEKSLGFKKLYKRKKKSMNDFIKLIQEQKKYSSKTLKTNSKWLKINIEN